jgi:hypothetical protein
MNARRGILIILACFGLACGLARGRAESATQHWSLKPLALISPPNLTEANWCKTPIDRFILARLEQHRMKPGAAADKRTLLRRAYFDLTGLPPKPEEMARFLGDESAEAFDRVLDDLLSRPEYGERWARHWLDVAHYAETHGHDQDRPRTNAWPYRDYVIESLNSDKPYARFVEEQIAGDVLFPDDPRATVAMGFLATGPWDESSLRDIREDTIDRQVARYIDRDDIVTTVMNTFVSTTVQCARCHDHKFDPISQREYYNLQAIFAGTEKGNRVYDSDPGLHRHRQDLIRRKNAIREKPPDEEDTIALCETEEKLHSLPPPELVYAGAHDFVPDGGHKPAAKMREVRLLKRGDINKPGDLAVPGALECVPELRGQFTDCEDEGSRRGALAHWITNPANAFSWRSIVNRVWHYHFGRGIVNTPNDFGRMGGLPSHPELLDWLANWFIENGGSFKKLHKLIMASAVYQQSSRDNPEYAMLDSENTLLWRMNRSRLDAESVRDTILALSGTLDARMGGPSAQHFLMSPGIHVTPKVDYAGFDVDRPEARRRSVYRFVFRTLPDPLMDALDCPDASQLTATRNSSVTVSQALAMLNDQFVVRYAEHFATALRQAVPEVDGQVSRGIELAFSRPALKEEIARYRTFTEKHGLANFCRVLFNSNEFLFIN